MKVQFVSLDYEILHKTVPCVRTTIFDGVKLTQSMSNKNRVKPARYSLIWAIDNSL